VEEVSAVFQRVAEVRISQVYAVAEVEWDADVEMDSAEVSVLATAPDIGFPGKEIRKILLREVL
jgi:hypothetical protein